MPDDVGALAGLDHAEPARLALERAAGGELCLALASAAGSRRAARRPPHAGGPLRGRSRSSSRLARCRGRGRARRRRSAPSAPSDPSGSRVRPSIPDAFVRRARPPSSATLCPEDAPPGVRRVGAERLLDAQQLVVLGDAIRARRRAGLDLAAAGGDGEVGDRRVLGLARAVATSRPCSRWSARGRSRPASRSACRSG